MKKSSNTFDIQRGDCLSKLPHIETESIDAVITDPPYGLGFLGHDWDALPPGKEVFCELLRVLKPGGHALVFGGTRTIHRTIAAAEDSGFEVRDMLMWVYANGFPKQHNISRSLQKAGKTKASEEFEGWNANLKPAWEPITLLRKPLQGSLSQNMSANGVGGINVKEWRIPMSEEDRKIMRKKAAKGGVKSALGYMGGTNGIGAIADHPDGRYPSNVVSTSPILGNFDRYFYVEDDGLFLEQKAKKKDKTMNGAVLNNHPTTKPISLMKRLIKLVVPSSRSSIILDPFLGSGSTLVAAKSLNEEGYNLSGIGIELDPEYAKISKARLASIESLFSSKEPIAKQA